MSKNYDGWIAKDKYGRFWLTTLGSKKDVELRLKGEWARSHGFKIVKVKLVEVE